MQEIKVGLVRLGAKMSYLKVCCLLYADDAMQISNRMEDVQSLVSKMNEEWIKK